MGLLPDRDIGCNGPFLAEFQKDGLFRSYPDDLRPSRLAATMARFGSATEFATPAILYLSTGNMTITVISLLVTSENLVPKHVSFLLSLGCQAGPGVQEPGECAVVSVESQALFIPHRDREIHDAATGKVAEGRTPVHPKLTETPWPTGKWVEKLRAGRAGRLRRVRVRRETLLAWWCATGRCSRAC